MPRVSVIVAARDAADTLPEALASVAAQTFDDHEVIVVDDGSSDATVEVARRAEARVVRSSRSEGPAAARNRAAAAARGELLAVLDADDAYKPDYLASQTRAYDAARLAGRRVGAVCCDAELVAPDGRTLRWTDRVGCHSKVTLGLLLRENVVFGLALVPRDVFLSLGGYDADPRIAAEDYDLWLRMLETGHEVVFNPEVLAVYRLRGDARSAQVAEVAAGSRLIFDRALARGRLTAWQRRLARRRRRLFRVVELRARLGSSSSTSDRLQLWPLALLVALEHPDRWRHWVRRGPRPAREGRHTGA